MAFLGFGLPNRQQMIAFAKKETDPRFYNRFKPITRGPLVAVLILFALALPMAFFIGINFILRYEK